MSRPPAWHPKFDTPTRDGFYIVFYIQPSPHNKFDPHNKDKSPVPTMNIIYFSRLSGWTGLPAKELHLITHWHKLPERPE